MPVRFTGGLKEANSGIHAFMMMTRVGPDCQLLIIIWPDCPREINIESSDKHGRIRPHEHDIIIFVKRNASDKLLAQAVHVETPCLKHPRQEPLLGAPYSLLAPVLQGSPTLPRPLRRVDPEKAKRYMELVDLLLNRFPSDTSGRAAEFLMDLVRSTDPGALPLLPWFEGESHPARVRIENAAVLRRAMPSMRFQARF